MKWYITKFRVSFGNGQVTKSFRTLKDAQLELKKQNSYFPGNYYIQAYDCETQEWFRYD